MSEQKITRKAKEFYGKYSFPGDRPVDQDGLIFLRRFTKAVERITSTKEKIRVLDAGCGTGNTSVSLASRFKNIQFLELDNSSPSLDKAKQAAAEKGLKNVKFRRWNLLRPVPGGQRYDLILCLGVLHHTGNMEKVLVNLSNALEEDGELFLWIYGKHGRYRHSLNTRLLKMLLEVEPGDEVELASEFALKTDNGQPLNDLIGNTKTNEMQLNAFRSPVWIADQFLNPHETLIDMEELLHLTGKTGFQVVQLLGMEGNIATKLGSAQLSERFSKLSRNDQLIGADLLLKPERYFVVLRKIEAGRRNV